MATYRSSSSGNNGAGNGSSYGVTLPSGWAAGDLVLVIVAVGVASAAFNALTGWVLDRQDSNSGGATHTTAVYYRRMQTGDTNPTFTSTTGGKAAWAAVAVQPGVGEVISLDGLRAETTTTTTGTSASPPAMTAGTTDCSILLFGTRATTNSATAINVTTSSSWTEGSDSSTATGTTTATRQIEAEVSYRDGVTAGSVAPGAATTNVSVCRNVYHYLVQSNVTTPFSTATDNFDDGTLDPVLWSTYGAATTESGGRAQVPCVTGDNGLATTGFTLVESYILFRMFPAAAGGGTGVFNVMTLYTLVSGYNAGFNLQVETGNLNLFLYFGGTDPGPVNLTYSSTDHAWLRLRETGSTLYWDTSPDGFTWTNRRSAASPSWVGDPWTWVDFYSHRDSGTGDSLQIDNFNVIPSAPLLWRPARGPNYRR